MLARRIVNGHAVLPLHSESSNTPRYENYWQPARWCINFPPVLISLRSDGVPEDKDTG